MTKEELAFFRKHNGFNFKSPIHRVWHDFAKRFMDNEGRTFKGAGHTFMARVNRWAKKYPDDVVIVGCDDAYYASSDLVLIEHKTETDYHGITVVYMPQCTGESPIAFFLYPGHRDGLLSALLASRAKARPIQRLERAKQRERQKFWRKSKP